MNKLTKMFIALFVSSCMALFLGSSGIAAEYPAKPITLIISYGAGGSIDLAVRALADTAKKYLGQPVICENKLGGGGVVGFSAMVTKPPDGYTLEATPSSMLVAWNMGNLNYHPVEDITPIMRWGWALNGLVVRADSPWKTLNEFIQYSKANPQKVTYGSPGTGTLPHLIMLELSSFAGVQWTHVPYKGNVDANSSLLGGFVDAFCGGTGWAPLVDAGKFRLLATFGDQRSPRYPDVPTVKELLGHSLVSTIAFVGLSGPKGMSKPIVDKLDSAFKNALYEPGVQAVMKKLDFTTTYLNSEDCAKSLRREVTSIGEIIKKLGLQKK